MRRRLLTLTALAATGAALAGAGVAAGGDDGLRSGAVAPDRPAPSRPAPAPAAPAPPAPAAAPARTLELRLEERTLGLSSREVRAGRVTLRERNDGQREHDLLIVRTDVAPDRLPMGLEGPSPSAAGPIVLGDAHPAHAHEAARGAHHLAPGAERTRRIALRPGNYVLICPLPGHYEAGQRASLVVR